MRSAVSEQHSETLPLPGRDLSPAFRGDVAVPDLAAPISFMTEDEISQGDIRVGALSGEEFDVVQAPSCVESVIADVDGSLWKLNRCYDAEARTDEEAWELHDLSSDPGERENRYRGPNAPTAAMETLLIAEREAKRLTPSTAH